MRRLRDPSMLAGQECPCSGRRVVLAALRADLDRYRYLAEVDHHESAGWLTLARSLILYPGLYGVVTYRLAHAARTSRLPAPVRAGWSAVTVLLHRLAMPVSGVDLDARAH